MARWFFGHGSQLVLTRFCKQGRNTAKRAWRQHFIKEFVHTLMVTLKYSPNFKALAFLPATRIEANALHFS